MKRLMQPMRQAMADGRLRPLDLALAEWCLRHGGTEPVALAMALVSQAVGAGHSCLWLGEPVTEALSLPEAPPLCEAAEVAQALQESTLVGRPGESRPLILEHGRLYLHRYWQHESRLAERLRALIDHPAEGLALEALGRDGGLFDYAWVDKDETHWQAVAAAVALRQRFSVISGGPGTGKTYTVLRLIRMLVDDALDHDRQPPLIRLAAPTGKAAARMMESVHAGLAGLADGERLRPLLPERAFTLHRLLGLGRYGTRARHDRDNPLTAEAVIVDEASMVDLPLMARLAEAIPMGGRLILLGDRYQLASVESGSVLAEICRCAGMNEFTPAQHQELAPLLQGDAPPAVASRPALADHVVTLQTSHRFSPDSAIGRLAAAVNAGEAERAMTLATASGETRDLELVSAPDPEALAARIADACAALVEATEPEAALAALDAVRLLTATRVGPHGAEAMNRLIHRRLADNHGFDPDRQWFHGRPVIVLHNDYRVGLFNGDTGVCLRGEDGRLRVWFRAEDGLRQLLPTALPEHETVFAMTVHKSQGSEFDHVYLLLPDRDMHVLSRELVYTGITRARQRLTLMAPEATLRAALARTVARTSGLGARLVD